MAERDDDPKPAARAGQAGSWQRLLLLRLAALGLGMLLPLLLLEVLLRFLPVNEGLHTLAVNDANPVVRFAPDRDAIWSDGWRFQMVNRVHTNNFGFVCDEDYEPDATTPLLAVVGDSYVQASMLPYPDTSAGRLARHLGERARVYPFGVSGAPLSQYLVFAEYARENFRPDVMVVMSAGNDFDESLRKYKSEPGLHYFVQSPDGGLILERVDFSIDPLRKVVRASALARYLVGNLEIQAAPRRLKRVLAGGNAAYVGSTASEASPERVADSRRATDAFLDQLPARAGLEPAEILLVVDGMRPHLYDAAQLEQAQGSFVQVMRDHLIAGARTRGHPVVDLQTVFLDHYAQHGKRFEFESDNHWNALGHEIVFRSIEDSGLLDRLVAARRDGEGRLASRRSSP